jgi:hypothetical protein
VRRECGRLVVWCQSSYLKHAILHSEIALDMPDDTDGHSSPPQRPRSSHFQPCDVARPAKSTAALQPNRNSVALHLLGLMPREKRTAAYYLGTSYTKQCTISNDLILCALVWFEMEETGTYHLIWAVSISHSHISSRQSRRSVLPTTHEHTPYRP